MRFYCLTSSAWDDFSTSQEALVTYDTPDALMNREPFSQMVASPVVEHPCMPLTKILSSGSFYHALDPCWDISSRLPVRLAREIAAPHDVGIFDGRFIWNEYIVRTLLDFREKLDSGERRDFDRCQFIVRRRLCSSNFFLTNDGFRYLLSRGMWVYLRWPYPLRQSVGHPWL